MKIVSVYSPKGGVGKTTIAVSLAAAYASSGLSTILVDVDEQETAYQVFYRAQKCTFDVMTAFPANPSYDVMIIDHHPSHTQVPFGSFIICPIEPCPISLISYEKSLSLLQDKQHILVVNNYDKSNRGDREFLNVLRKRGYPVAHVIARNPAFRSTISEHKTVFDVFWRTGARKARKQIKQLQELIA